jgi:nitroreductase
MLKELILKNRSYRRFHQEYEINKEDLLSFIDLARLSASAKNSQSLKYYISNDEELNKQIFSSLAWAGFLKDWDGPIEGEQASAYIVITLDKDITNNNYCDHGIAAQSILLGAVEKDLGGCIIAAINKKSLRETLNIPENLEILLVLAIGKPKEEINIYEIDKNEDTKYWRDKNQVHQVPKRKLKDIVINY